MKPWTLTLQPYKLKRPKKLHNSSPNRDLGQTLGMVTIPDRDRDPECSTWNIQDLSTSYPQDFRVIHKVIHRVIHKDHRAYIRIRTRPRVRMRMCACACACAHVRTCMYIICALNGRSSLPTPLNASREISNFEIQK